MKSSVKVSIRTRLFIGFGSILVLIILAWLIAYLGINSITSSQKTLISIFRTTQELTQLRSDENRLRALMLEMILMDNQVGADTCLKAIRQQIEEENGRLIIIDQSLAEMPEERAVFTEIRTAMTLYRDNREKQLDLLRQGKIKEAATFAIKIQNPLYEEIRQKLFNIEKELRTHMDHFIETNASTEQRTNILLFLAGIVILIVFIALIADIFRLLHRISKEVKSGVNILGTSAAEILATVTQVSSGATETATSVSETTATIEEIRRTSLVATQRAQSVLESSQRASEAAENGKESVQQTIDGMNRIDQQMNQIAESVIKLSEQNRSIGEITSSVNDIADQSNLLAVNAAIEAAKAGEHGRGFAVVAQEIRSLAEQSKQATDNIKEILSEIQKAVNLAVMATEQGSKAVESGSRLSLKSGEMIDILAESVNEAVQSVLQISTSSQQQMAGMDQIVPAMENIKQASEQSVTGIRQTQNAARNLNDLGMNLKKIMDTYSI